MLNNVVSAVPSASLILLRDSPDGLQVLVARRNPELRMAGGFWVFPGGALEDGDRQRAAAVDQSDALLPFRLNAVRETREEVGLCIEPVSDLIYFARWQAPDAMAMRFDTRFFVVRAPDDQMPEADNSELVELQWCSPQHLLEGSDRGRYLLMFPTIMNLRRLMGFETVNQVLAEAREHPVKTVKPTLLFRNGKAVAQVPAEAGFGLTEWEFPYPVKVVKPKGRGL